MIREETKVERKKRVGKPRDKISRALHIPDDLGERRFAEESEKSGQG